MSFEPDNSDYEDNIVDYNEEIIIRLDAIIRLLEVISDTEIGETLEDIRNDND